MPEVISRKDAKDAGLPRYYTGKPCKYGHMSERTVSRSTCVSCHNDLTRRKYWENREAERVRSAKYRAENKDKRRAYWDAYLIENREKVTARRRDYRARNRGSIAAKSREYVAANREIVLARKRKYYAENRERYRAYVRNRRATLRNAEGTHTKDDILNILNAQKWLCANPYCKADLRHAVRHVDHIVALAKGGRNSPENLQCLCGACNRSKHTKDFDEWLSQMENV